VVQGLSALPARLSARRDRAHRGGAAAWPSSDLCVAGPHQGRQPPPPSPPGKCDPGSVGYRTYTIAIGQCLMPGFVKLCRGYKIAAVGSTRDRKVAANREVTCLTRTCCCARSLHRFWTS